MAKLDLVGVSAFLATIFIVLGAVSFVGGESGGAILFILVGLLFGVVWGVSFWKAVK